MFYVLKFTKMKNLKSLIIPLVIFSALLYASCTSQFENLEKYNKETVYPGRYDTIFYRAGLERVEIDLMKPETGRIPSSKINMGKAVKTVYEYDNNVVTIDSLVSWINVKGLTEKKMYRFKVYTIDDFGNQSVPQLISGMPYTSLEKDLLDVSAPRVVMSTTGSIILDWPGEVGKSSLNTPIADFANGEFSYSDKNGVPFNKKFVNNEMLRFPIDDLSPTGEVTFQITYRLVPILEDGITRCIDTIVFNKPLVLNMPTASSTFNPTEGTILWANGINFSYGQAMTTKKLIYPLHVRSFSDLFYFTDLDELDLTGSGLKGVMPVLTQSGNGATAKTGGGDCLPYYIRSEYTKVFPVNSGNLASNSTAGVAIDSWQTLQDMLETGQLKKITYHENSLTLDTMFQRFVDKGTLELIIPDEDWFPEEITLDPTVAHQGQVGAGAFRSVFEYPLPLSQVPKPDDVMKPDEVYRVEPQMRNATFAFTTSREYIWDLERYRYLKFKVYLTGGGKLLTTSGNGQVGNYRVIWMRIRYRFWTGDAGNNKYDTGGDNLEYKTAGNVDFSIPVTAVNNNWIEFTYDMGPATGKATTSAHTAPWNLLLGHHHIRNICFSLGGEQGPDGGGNNLHEDTRAAEIKYYFADIRLCKSR